MKHIDVIPDGLIFGKTGGVICGKKHLLVFPWSSAQAIVQLVKVELLLELVADWEGFLDISSDEEVDIIQRHERTGHPLGNNVLVETLEKFLGRRLRPQKPGPKK